jgi:hypothetical protein
MTLLVDRVGEHLSPELRDADTRPWSSG